MEYPNSDKNSLPFHLNFFWDFKIWPLSSLEAQQTIYSAVLFEMNYSTSSHK